MNFLVGPSELHPKINIFWSEFLEKGYGSISHRSEAFHQLHQETIQLLQEILQIPKDFGIFFSGSASEIWERILLNGVNQYSYHLINGSFSNRFYDYAQWLDKKPSQHQVPFGDFFDIERISIPKESEMLCLTQNETSTGVWLSSDWIKKLKEKKPDALLALDIVSSAPVFVPDFNVVDTAFFSVQKVFGLPAGLGVWIASPKMLEKAKSIKASQSIGAHHQLDIHWKNFEKNETYSTPNILGIFLLNRVLQDFIKNDWNFESNRIKKRAQDCYQIFENGKNLYPLVKEKQFRSPTIIVLESPTEQTIQDIKKKLNEENIKISNGYGPKAAFQIRIANFPSISDDAWQYLTNILKTFI
jgi:phosphoserine aminotransferase